MHAFPVGVADGMGIMTPLCVIGSQIVGLRDSLEQDPFGLYTNKDMCGLKWLSRCFLVLVWLIAIVVGIKISIPLHFKIVRFGSILFVLLEMAVRTIYLQRDGWIFLDDSLWGYEPQHNLGIHDPKLTELIEWGDCQLIPNWNLPGEEEDQQANGTLLDLNSRVMVKVFVSGKPNALIALAIHGSGVTSMLVNRTDNLDSIVSKVGMCNIPPYMLAQTIRSGTLCIRIPSVNQER